MAFDADDLLGFVDADMPGYVLASIAGVPVDCLFRDRYAQAFDAASGSNPMLRCTDATSVARGASVVAHGRSYTVVDVEPEGIGMQLLILEAV